MIFPFDRCFVSQYPNRLLNIRFSMMRLLWINIVVKVIDLLPFLFVLHLMWIYISKWVFSELCTSSEQTLFLMLRMMNGTVYCRFQWMFRNLFGRCLKKEDQWWMAVVRVKTDKGIEIRRPYSEVGISNK